MADELYDEVLMQAFKFSVCAAPSFESFGDRTASHCAHCCAVASSVIFISMRALSSFH